MKTTLVHGSYTFRSLESHEDFHSAEIIQREIWGITDATDVVPKDVLLIVQKNGGLALGAFSPANEMIGLLFGFLGRSGDGLWKHCSHMMGVLPGYRSTGVGEVLKRIQRDFVLNQDIDLITWTVNPLEGVNASLNFGKLGVVCRNYLPNFYGEMSDGLNAGLPSDRFEVEWWVRSPRVCSRLDKVVARPFLADLLRDGAQLANSTVLERGLRLPRRYDPPTDELLFLFEVPADLQTIKKTSKPAALEWILHTREMLEHYIAAGYVISDFVSETEAGERRNYYVLQRGLEGILNR